MAAYLWLTPWDASCEQGVKSLLSYIRILRPLNAANPNLGAGGHKPVIGLS